MDDVVLKIEDLKVTYETSESTVEAVNGISFQVKKGQTIGIVGETGAGKTTTALSILRLLPERTGKIQEGKIFLEGEDLLKLPLNSMKDIRGSQISMIFQDPMSSLNPVIPIGDQIAEVLELHSKEKISIVGKLLRGKKKKKNSVIEKRVDEILELVGIPPERKNEYPHQFSGGMKQRVVIAMALVCQPKLVIADEPTTALDVTIQAQILDMMDNLKVEFDTAMILITHDLGVVAQSCDDVAIMYAGEIIEMGSVEEVFEPTKAHHPYTVGLFQSVPRIDDTSKRLKPITGLMPDPSNLPRGCKFHPRCPKAIQICTEELPEKTLLGGHMVQCHLVKAEDSKLVYST